MAKKIVKKKKLKIIPFFITLIALAIIGFSLHYFISLPLRNIVIKGTNYLNDDYIIDMVGIKNYPNFWSLNTTKMKNRLLSSPYVSEVKISRKFFNAISIDISESKPLYIDSNQNSIIFSNKKLVLVDQAITVFRIPRLINYVPDDKVDLFIKKMDRVNEEILGKISDIEYVPNEFDKDRFLLYMDDGNSVYVTITKFNNINYYNYVLSQLEGRKGILYLDSGNHFEIKE